MDLLNTILAVLFDGFLTGALILVIARMLVKPRYEKMKYESYECGDRSVGINRPRHDFHFYKYAFMFLVFDVGAMFFVFWAVLADPLEFLVPIVIFTAFLLAGLVYSAVNLGGDDHGA